MFPCFSTAILLLVFTSFSPRAITSFSPVQGPNYHHKPHYQFCTYFQVLEWQSTLTCPCHHHQIPQLSSEQRLKLVPNPSADMYSSSQRLVAAQEEEVEHRSLQPSIKTLGALQSSNTKRKKKIIHFIILDIYMFYLVWDYTYPTIVPTHNYSFDNFKIGSLLNERWTIFWI